VPNRKTALSQDEQLTMLDAALNASPKDKLTAAKVNNNIGPFS
jgi:hypothetical protein